MKDKYNREIDYIRISITQNCNLRCVYCIDENSYHPSTTNDLENSEIEKIVNQCGKLGIKKVRITGGEPLIRKDIKDLFYRLNKIENIKEIYMTTNGINLVDKIDYLKLNGLKGVNISLDTLRKDRFIDITKSDKLENVLNSINKALSLDIKVKINVVLIEDINKDEILDFVEFVKDKKIDLRFIELMPIGLGKKYIGVSNKEVYKTISSRYTNIQIAKKQNPSEVASYIKIDNHKSKIGFISAISDCFCDSCNKVRLTSDGFLKKCLHYNLGQDLKTLLRNNIDDDKLKEIIKSTIYDKPEKHLFRIDTLDQESRYMNQIGG